MPKPDFESYTDTSVHSLKLEGLREILEQIVSRMGLKVQEHWSSSHGDEAKTEYVLVTNDARERKLEDGMNTDESPAVLSSRPGVHLDTVAKAGGCNFCSSKGEDRAKAKVFVISGNGIQFRCCRACSSVLMLGLKSNLR